MTIAEAWATTAAIIAMPAVFYLGGIIVAEPAGKWRKKPHFITATVLLVVAMVCAIAGAWASAL